jgi:hypothetical protein
MGLLGVADWLLFGSLNGAALVPPDTPEQAKNDERTKGA